MLFLFISSKIVGSTVHLTCLCLLTSILHGYLLPASKHSTASKHREPCSGPQRTQRITGSAFRISLQPDWRSRQTKQRPFFNWPIVARTQIWVHSWKSRTRISALFADEVNQSLISSARRLASYMRTLFLPLCFTG